MLLEPVYDTRTNAALGDVMYDKRTTHRGGPCALGFTT